VNYSENRPATRTVAIDVSGGDQTLGTGLGPALGIYVGGNGNLVCRLKNDTADTTFTGLIAGNVYYLAVAIIRQTGTTVTNSRVLY
jgi:hypothetical protein